MNVQHERSHSADFLFPIILFLIFALLTIEVVIFAAKVYSSVLDKESINYEAGTCVNYVKEKIHQNDNDGNVCIADFDGCPALALRKNIKDSIYTTYIYEHGGQIKELFTQEGVPVTADSGTAIMKVDDFDLKQLNGRLLYVSCTDENGKTAESYICIRSGKTE